MMVPNHSDIPRKLFDTGLFDLKTTQGHDSFTDAVVSTLKGRDPKWRHLKKRADQTHIHRHGEDSALYLLPDGKALAVDFISGAGGPTPKPGWIVGTFEYTHSDAHDPENHGIGESVPPPVIPTYEALGGDEGGKRFSRVLDADYKRAEKPGVDGDFGAWPWRTCYDFLAGICATVEESTAKHQPEWREALNNERVSQGKPPIAW